MSRSPQVGKFYGVGVGPGDPKLITLRAKEVLEKIPVVFVPRKGPGEFSYALSVVEDLLPPNGQEIVELIFPMVKERERLLPAWEKAAQKVWETLKTGRDSAMITEGDPMVYSTFLYVWERIARDHPEVEVEIVPGVSSITAAAADARFPLADGEDKVAILPAAYDLEAIRRALEEYDTVVILKANSVIEPVVDLLEEKGLLDSAVFVQKASTLDRYITRDIRDLKTKNINYLSLLIVRTRADEAASPFPAAAGKTR